MSDSHHKTVRVSIEFEKESMLPKWEFCPAEVSIELPATVIYELDPDSFQKGWSFYNLANIQVTGDLNHVVGKTCKKARQLVVTLEGESEGASIGFDFVANFRKECTKLTYTSNDPRIIIGKPG